MQGREHSLTVAIGSRGVTPFHTGAGSERNGVEL